MDARLICQPVPSAAQAGPELGSMLSQFTGGRFHTVVAWAKSSGLSRIEDAVREFRAKGGRADMLLGLDANGATWEGLALALDVFDEVRVFHDPGARTFHPKLYIARATDHAAILIGSSNLTAGGLFTNYELGVSMQLDLLDDAERALLDQALEYRQWFVADAQHCIRLTVEILDSWRQRPPTAIASERSGTYMAGSLSGGRGGDGPFGAAVQGLPSVPSTKPGQPLAGGGLAAATTQGPSGHDTESPHVGEEGDPVTTVRRWTKKLRRSDAQQPSLGSNPTGNLRLTKAGHPIDWRTFFRNDLLATAHWTAGIDGHGQTIERATIPIVADMGGGQSTHHLAVSHAPHRESGQANHTTVLHWGSLMDTLTATDHTDDYVAISRLSDGSFLLEVMPWDPGAII